MRPRTTQLSYHLAVFIGLAAMHSMVHGSPAADPAEAAVSAGPDTHALAGTPQTFSGRLMTLFHFAGGDRPRPSQWLNPPPNPENGQQSRDWKNDSVTPATPAAVVAAAPKGSLGSSTNLTPAGVPPPPRAGTWGGQALALVVSSATAAAVSAPAQQPYILVFDPLNSASRSSFARAQWILAGRGQEVDLGSVTGSAPGKKEVRGADERPTPTPAKPGPEAQASATRERGRVDTNSAAELKAEAAATWTRSYPPQGAIDEREVPVRITGWVLHDPPLAAIVVTEIAELPANEAP